MLHTYMQCIVRYMLTISFYCHLVSRAGQYTPSSNFKLGYLGYIRLLFQRMSHGLCSARSGRDGRIETPVGSQRRYHGQPPLITWSHLTNLFFYTVIWGLHFYIRVYTYTYVYIIILKSKTHCHMEI